MNKKYLLGRFILFLVTCLMSLQNEAFAKGKKTSSSQSQVSIYVDFIVVTPDDSVGANKKWLDRKFVQRNLNAANANLFGMVTFQLGEIQQYKSSSLYNSPKQTDSLSLARSNQQANRITVAISGPSTQDSLGVAYTSKNYYPLFAMRSYYNDAKTSYSTAAIDHNSLIFIHELAHNMGIGHCEEGSTKICADNIWTSTTYAAEVVKYLDTVVNYYQVEQVRERPD
jgi:hypothetical protein